MIDPKKIEEWRKLVAISSQPYLSVMTTGGYGAPGDIWWESDYLPAAGDALPELLAEREESLALLSECVVLKREAAANWRAALALLREVEWVGKGEVNPRHCPVCLGLKPGDSRSLFGIDDERDGHAPDCRLAAMLKG